MRGRDENGTYWCGHGHNNDWGSEHFTGGIAGGGGICEDSGVNAAFYDVYNKSGLTLSQQSYPITEDKVEDFSMSASNSTSGIEMWSLGNNYLFGPFIIQCSYNGDYEYKVIDNSNREITISAENICDANGNQQTYTGNATFYIKIPKEKCANGISRVIVSTQKSGYEWLRTITKCKIIFTPSSNAALQGVGTMNLVEVLTAEEHVPRHYNHSVEWTNIRGAIEIIKQDTDNPSVKLSGVGFKIKNSNGYIQEVNNNGSVLGKLQGTINLGNLRYTTDVNQATEFITDSSGNIQIYNLPTGTYTITEVTNNHYGYLVNATGSIAVKSGMAQRLVVNNTKQTGILKIEKRDEQTSAPLSGVGFKLRNSSGSYIIAVDYNNRVQTKPTGTIYLGNLQYTTNASQATEFMTDSSGNIQIYNLLVGTYTVTETSLGNNDGYEIDNNYITSGTNGGAATGKGATATITVTRQKSTNVLPNSKATTSNVLRVNNRRKYIRLKGYAWEDFPEPGKENNNNGLYKGSATDINDKLLNGITVQLKDNNNQVIASTTTNTQGAYTFEKVEIDKLEQYYIEFQYNGLNYTNVDFKPEQANGSKVKEGTNRTDFNNAYKTISYGKSNSYDLKYETANYSSKLLYRQDENKSAYNYGYTGSEADRAPISGIDAQYIIQANTKNAYQTDTHPGYLDAIKSATDIRNEALTELNNINLGIQKRAQPDLSIIKDLESVKVSINGVSHVYKYADRFNPDLYKEYNDDGDSGYIMEPQVKFGSKYGSMTYTRALYASDIYYDADVGIGNSEPLKVEVTYKIGIKNTAGNLNAVINEITDYYDTKYLNDEKYIKVGTEINEDGTIKAGKEVAYEIETSENANYNKITIKPNLNVPATGEGAVYVQLQVEREKIVDILGDNDQEVKLDNIVEISSYSIKDESNNAYAGIDVDAQPGNLDIDNQFTYEDDTDKAPGIKLVLQEQRKLSGQVFIDETTSESDLATGEIRQGDGIYTQGEKGLEDVEVKLIDSNGNVVKQLQGEEWVDAITYTDGNGEYRFEGFIPDEYQIVYTWGDKTYKVQDYKGTIVDKSSYEAKANNVEWYKDEFKQSWPDVEWNSSSDSEIRVSDAVDNYGTRKKIDTQTQILTNANKNVINQYSGEMQVVEEGIETTLITKMDSTTPNFRVNIEYSTDPTNHKDEYVTEDGQIVMNGVYVSKNNGHKNQLNSIDFGIVERARQVLELNKRIENVKVILADGSVLINAEIEEKEDGTLGLKEEVKHTVYMPKSATEGQVKLEIDSEIIQNQRLEIEYGLKITNKSELDYNNPEFYRYGKGHGENANDIITLNPTQIIDYLDNEAVTNIQDGEQWEILQEATKKGQLITDGLLENTDAMKNLLNGESRVILIDELATELRPDDENEITIKGYRLLSNNNTTISTNHAEIIQIEKPAGSTLITIPGNYIPNESETEYDDSESESVTIIPPPGLSTNYIAYTILAISSLGILLSGIILIKKLVLRK